MSLLSRPLDKPGSAEAVREFWPTGAGLIPGFTCGGMDPVVTGAWNHGDWPGASGQLAAGTGMEPGSMRLI